MDCREKGEHNQRASTRIRKPKREGGTKNRSSGGSDIFPGLLLGAPHHRKTRLQGGRRTQPEGKHKQMNPPLNRSTKIERDGSFITLINRRGSGEGNKL